MATKLDKVLKRQIAVNGQPFVVTIGPDGFKLVGKGRRKGLEMSWVDLISGDAALATALQASIKAKVTLEPSKREAQGTKVAALKLVKGGRNGGRSKGHRQAGRRPH